ncbi:hypothetical protein K8640_33885 [Myxococcus sp. XM-1-1-1]|uniref:hypothetical protein n=1 Tax=Myxococcus sp. XM-1-1-1 TaxID=2874602 RepID=UPI001CBCE6F5|nr:hypothetical protein [Myxococcus sp. XM-1-1-1]MBZ4413222.1 hypothetical protein [Myxococcus sp. XM-1-1-1]
MDKFTFTGSFETDDAQVLSRLLQDGFKIPEPRTRVGRVGVEMVSESDGFYLFCHEAATRPGNPPRYLLEGSMSGALSPTRDRLQRLATLARERKVSMDLEFVQVNEEGDELSEPVIL